MIWFVSSVHSIKRIFVYNDNDIRVKPEIGSVLIILTGILYAKTYFALRKQNKSMVSKKATFPSTQSENTFSKSISTDSEICVREDGIEGRNKRADKHTQIQINRAESPSKRVQSRDVIAHDKDKLDESREQRVQSENERAQSQRERVQSEHQSC